MKHKNVQVGQRVIVKRSTSEYWDTAGRHIGKEFTVGEVEPLDYPGEGTVRLENAGGHGFWCNHKDIKLVREQAAPVPSPDETPAPEVGDLFEVVGNTVPTHRFNHGDVVRLECRDDNDGMHKYADTEVGCQFVDSSDLRALTKEDIWARLTAKPAAPKELSWPWPAGTRVRLSDSGNGRASLFDISPQAEYILGSDGSDYPPLMTFAGVRVFYVRERHVVLA
jgi:hypothetical protein